MGPWKTIDFSKEATGMCSSHSSQATHMYFVIGGTLDYLADDRGENDAWFILICHGAGWAQHVGNYVQSLWEGVWGGGRLTYKYNYINIYKYIFFHLGVGLTVDDVILCFWTNVWRSVRHEGQRPPRAMRFSGGFFHLAREPFRTMPFHPSKMRGNFHSCSLGTGDRSGHRRLAAWQYSLMEFMHDNGSYVDPTHRYIMIYIYIQVYIYKSYNYMIIYTHIYIYMYCIEYSNPQQKR